MTQSSGLTNLVQTTMAMMMMTLLKLIQKLSSTDAVSYYLTLYTLALCIFFMFLYP